MKVYFKVTFLLNYFSNKNNFSDLVSNNFKYFSPKGQQMLYLERIIGLKHKWKTRKNRNSR